MSKKKKKRKERHFQLFCGPTQAADVLIVLVIKTNGSTNGAAAAQRKYRDKDHRRGIFFQMYCKLARSCRGACGTIWSGLAWQRSTAKGSRWILMRRCRATETFIVRFFAPHLCSLIAPFRHQRGESESILCRQCVININIQGYNCFPSIVNYKRGGDSYVAAPQRSQCAVRHLSY